MPSLRTLRQTVRRPLPNRKPYGGGGSGIYPPVAGRGLTRAVPASRAEHAVPGEASRRPSPPPLGSRLLLVIARSGKKRSKLVKNHFETTSVIFCLRSKNEVTELKKRLNFPKSGRDNRNLHISQELWKLGRRLKNQSKALEICNRRRCPQIWPLGHRLASRGHQSSKKPFFGKTVFC